MIKDLKDGSKMNGVVIVKDTKSGTTRTGKSYKTVTLQDKSGTVEGKIWDLNPALVGPFENGDIVSIKGDVSSYNGALQVSVRSVWRAPEGSYNLADLVPSTGRDVDKMLNEIHAYIAEVKNTFLRTLLLNVYGDKNIQEQLRIASAAKGVHHAFVGGLLEHTCGVTALCEAFAGNYPEVLNRDLLITAALLHDIGKIRELSRFPENDYTDDGKLLGHIVLGAELIHDNAREIPHFPETLERELVHCILAHHGMLEYGSPKKPALPEAWALHLADNMDAKMEVFKEAFASAEDPHAWLGFNRALESDIRKSTI